MGKLNRRAFLKAAGVAGTSLALQHLSLAGMQSDAGMRPNIVLVMPDDGGCGDYACLGNPIMRTPSVDAFKTQSLLLTQFHVSPTCSPCRASLMSGRHEFKNGVTHTILERERMSLKTYTLAQMLKSGGVPAAVECNALSAHIDIFPTFAEITGARLSDEVKKQVEGRSLLPLLKNPKAEWPDRMLVHHVGRWATGKAPESKYTQCSIQNSRFTLVNNKELYDLKMDPGETENVIAEHPDVVAKLRAAYDEWWDEVQPLLVNEDVVGPQMNPFKDLYWKQFGGGPDEQLLERMNPEKKFANEATAGGRRKRNARTGENNEATGLFQMCHIIPSPPVPLVRIGRFAARCLADEHPLLGRRSHQTQHRLHPGG